MKQNSMILVLMLTMLLTATVVQAQTGLHKVNWRDARITDVGAYVMDMRVRKPITLSAMCACPTNDDVSRINNIILGTHITITADSQCPSNRTNGWGQDDWGMYFSLAAGNKLDYVNWMRVLRYLATDFLETPIGFLISALNDYNNADRSANYNNDLVIMPDYEGYGLTRDRAHPYLYQELTARQCLDALLYGISLYESSPDIESVRHPIRSNFRTMVSGYSQGGSVAIN